MRIALLEDEPEQSQYLPGINCERGHSCGLVETIQAFLMAVLYSNHGLLLSDWQTPGITGFNVFKSVPAQIYCSVFLLLAPRDSETDTVNTLDANDFLAGPARPAHCQSPRNILPLCSDTSGVAARHRNVVDHGAASTVTHKNTKPVLFVFQNQRRLLTSGAVPERVWGRNPDSGVKHAQAMTANG